MKATTEAIVHTQILTRTQIERLNEIAAALQSGQVEMLDGLRMCAGKAIEAGKQLIEVKEILKHGDFGAWCEKNTPYSWNQCNHFMRVSKLPIPPQFDFTDPVCKLVEANKPKAAQSQNRQGKPQKPSQPAEAHTYKFTLTPEKDAAYLKKAGGRGIVEWLLGLGDGAVAAE